DESRRGGDLDGCVVRPSGLTGSRGPGYGYELAASPVRGRSGCAQDDDRRRVMKRAIVLLAFTSGCGDGGGPAGGTSGPGPKEVTVPAPHPPIPVPPTLPPA